MPILRHVIRLLQHLDDAHFVHSFLSSPAHGGAFNRLIFHFESNGEELMTDVEVEQSSSIDDGMDCKVERNKVLGAPYHSTSKYFLKFLLKFGKM